MGRYAPRSKFVELYLNKEYRGVYVLMEKIKRDKNRVAISSLDPNSNFGDNLTGGYILKFDWAETGDNNGGEAQQLAFYCVHSGGNARTISVL